MRKRNGSPMSPLHDGQIHGEQTLHPLLVDFSPQYQCRSSHGTGAKRRLQYAQLSNYRPLVDQHPPRVHLPLCTITTTNANLSSKLPNT